MILGVLSDAHGHTAALRRAIAVLQNANATQLIFLGDAVGYIPDAEAMEMLIAQEIPVIMGNHERMMLDESAPNELKEVYQHSKTREGLKQSTLDAVRKLNKSLFFYFDDIRVEAFHGSPNDALHGYVYPDSDLSDLRTSAHVVVVGHTHRPFVRSRGSTMFVNAGSCALPRDTGRYGSVAVIDTVALKSCILRFDISDLAESVISNHSLHQSVIDALRRRPAGSFEGVIVDV